MARGRKGAKTRRGFNAEAQSGAAGIVGFVGGLRLCYTAMGAFGLGAAMLAIEDDEGGE